jgi:hypothetical protein
LLLSLLLRIPPPVLMKELQFLKDTI